MFKPFTLLPTIKPFIHADILQNTYLNQQAIRSNKLSERDNKGIYAKGDWQCYEKNNDTLIGAPSIRKKTAVYKALTISIMLGTFRSQNVFTLTYNEKQCT